MQHVDVKINGSAATLLIRRPETLGALDPVLIADLQTALGDVHGETKVRGVILAGGGPYFSSGLDRGTMDRIAAMDTLDATSQWFRYWQSWTELVETMLRFPKPIVAAVDGPAIGAGFGLALAADMIVASTSASFAAIAPRLGLVGGATAALLHFRLGAAAAARWTLTGETIDADAAARIGLTEPPVTSDQVWVTANAIIDQIALSTPQAIAATRRMLNETIGESLITQLHAAAADSVTLSTAESTVERLTG